MPLSDRLTVFIVDDDPAIRDALSLLLGLRGYRTALFASADDFLRALRPDWAGCLIVDIRMPGIDGLALQELLLERGLQLPVIVISAHGDMASARRAFRAHAVDFLEKPLDDDKLMASIEEALGAETVRLGEMEAEVTEAREVEGRRAALTPREQEVMERVVQGRHNREIAAELGISVRTVEVHKSRLMAKLGVRNLPDLVRLAISRVTGDP